LDRPTRTKRSSKRLEKGKKIPQSSGGGRRFQIDHAKEPWVRRRLSEAGSAQKKTSINKLSNQGHGREMVLQSGKPSIRETRFQTNGLHKDLRGVRKARTNYLERKLGISSTKERNRERERSRKGLPLPKLQGGGVGGRKKSKVTPKKGRHRKEWRELRKETT